MLYVPRGFAHGFIRLTDNNVEAFYLNSHVYSPDAERGLRWNNSALGIDWPSEPRDTSDKDRQWSNLNPEFHGLESMRGLT